MWIGARYEIGGLVCAKWWSENHLLYSALSIFGRNTDITLRNKIRKEMSISRGKHWHRFIIFCYFNFFTCKNKKTKQFFFLAVVLIVSFCSQLLLLLLLWHSCLLCPLYVNSKYISIFHVFYLFYLNMIIIFISILLTTKKRKTKKKKENVHTIHLNDT